MSVEANKQLVRDYWKAFAVDVDKAFEFMSEDVVYQLPPGSGGGEMSKTEVRAILSFVMSHFAQTPVITIPSMIGEDDKIAMELKLEVPLKDGRRYDNVYCFMITIRDGRIARIHEYPDTYYASTRGFIRAPQA